ncbi:MAG: DUF4136 domain-containing protein [Thermoanaerobaculia bacterium]
MKSLWKLGVVLMGIVAVSACSSIETSMDYNPSATFGGYKTYAWKDLHESQNQLLENRIKSSVDGALSSKGLRKVDADPDLWVVYHTRLSEQTQINTYDTGWGYGWGWGRYGRAGMGTSTATVQQIPVGTLIVDLVDAKASELAWRGTATKTLDPSASAEKKSEAVNAAVQKMFAAYPPGAGK